jgi:hypothetical protein
MRKISKIWLHNDTVKEEMKKLIRKYLVGDVPVSEYSTVTIRNEIIEKVYLETGTTQKDISDTHWLLCLNPIIFGIWFGKDEDMIKPGRDSSSKMYFKDSHPGGINVAVLELTLFDEIKEEDGTMILLKPGNVSVNHVNRFKTWVLFHRYYKKPEQDFYKLKSYSAAYSYPRKVRLISFKEDNWFNIFPMDLVGDIPMSRRYVFGLRHTNVTLARIIETKKMVVSEIPYQFKDLIYQLGKHHRQPLSESKLPFEIIQSDIYKFPVPVWVNSYKEIRIVKTLNLGSHMLLWGEEINVQNLNNQSGHLYHIHFLHYLHQKRREQAYPLI